MADRPLKSALKKAKVEFVIVTDPITGAITRVPKTTATAQATTTVAPPAVPAATTIAGPRPAITSAVLKKPAPIQVDEEEIDFNAPAAASTAAAAATSTAAAAAATATFPVSPAAETVEEELDFNTFPTMTIPQTVKPAVVPAVAVAAAATEPKGERKSKKGKEEDITTLDDIGKMKAFYRYKVKDPFFYTYTQEGNLEIKANNKAKIPAMVIPLRAFSALTPEEFEEIERFKRDEQANVEQDYVAKMKELRAAYDAYSYGNDTAEHIVLLNEELRELSVLRNTILYPERWVKTIANPDTNIILLDEKKEQRKLGYDVYCFKRTDISVEDAFGRYRPHGAGAAMQGGGEDTVVLFITDVEDPNTGQFHPTFVREFVYNETKYASPYQAYEVERFKELNNEDIVEQLLGTRSAKTIKQIVSGEKQHPKNPQQLWEDILEASYTQSKEAASALQETGSARFHVMDKVYGSPEYANALVSVRTSLKEQEGGAPANAEFTQSVITEKEQAKARVGAIVNNFRKNH